MTIMSRARRFVWHYARQCLVSRLIRSQIIYAEGLVLEKPYKPSAQTHLYNSI